MTKAIVAICALCTGAAVHAMGVPVAFNAPVVVALSLLALLGL